MPISVVCECGARLEIDEKFLGKEVPCPDCQRPLPTKPPATPPPLELPDSRRVCGLAALSLTLALVGAFTIVGTLAAIAIGVVALREIARQPNKLEGAGFARAGIALGGFFTLLTLIALLLPTAFGLDVIMRELMMAGRIEYSSGDFIKGPAVFDQDVEIKRPSDAWAKYQSPTNQTIQADPLIIINVAEDAFIACQLLGMDGPAPKGEERKKVVLERFYKSELVDLMGRLGGKPLKGEGTIFEEKEAPASNTHTIILDLRLAGIDRRFLIRYPADDNKLNIVIDVAGARRSQFERLQGEFLKTFDTIKTKS